MIRLFVPWIRLIGPNGALVSSSLGNLTATIAATATLNGTYTLLVTDSAVSREPSHAGTYVVTMFKGPGTFVVPTGDHGGTLLNNVARAGAIYRGDLDEWTFLAAIWHNALTVTISEIISGTDPGFIPWIRLIGPTGAVVGQALGVQTATINLVAPTTGIYTVIVADSDVSREGAAPGNYTLTAIGVDPNVCDGGRSPGLRRLEQRMSSRCANASTPYGNASDYRSSTSRTRVPQACPSRRHTSKSFAALCRMRMWPVARRSRRIPIPVLTPQFTFIKAVHINQLCVAVAFLE